MDTITSLGDALPPATAILFHSIKESRVHLLISTIANAVADPDVSYNHESDPAHLLEMNSTPLSHRVDKEV